MLRLHLTYPALPQPARAQVPKAASTAQLSVFRKIDIAEPLLFLFENKRMKLQNNGYLLKLKTSTYNQYYNCVCVAWQK